MQKLRSIPKTFFFKAKNRSEYSCMYTECCDRYAQYAPPVARNETFLTSLSPLHSVSVSSR